MYWCSTYGIVCNIVTYVKCGAFHQLFVAVNGEIALEALRCVLLMQSRHTSYHYPVY